ncbi:MAG TPA: class I SAM-dependent methyltransferase [Anaerolineae bacterium]|nr:class I SAM-dependent methyltransferase [Anaerolineae bacterium]
MNLQLAIASSCTGTGCQVQSLDSDVHIDADYSEAVIDYGITISPGDLVAVDYTFDPPQVVFRWALTGVERVENEQVFTDSACGGSQALILAEGLEANIAVGDKVFIAYGEVHDVSRGKRPVNPERLRAAFFPRIEAMYQRLAAWRDTDPKQVVKEGYDCIAERYLEWARTNRAEERARYTSVLLDELPRGAKVLDLGCGAGVPTTQQLAQRFEVTGVDFSARQLALARQNVPQAQFIQADITQLNLPPGSFDGVAAFYSLIHVPREEQPNLLQDIASWLHPGGLFVATMGVHSVKADFAEDYLGTPMYWSGFDSETNERLVEEAGLRIISTREETATEFDKSVTFLWIIAQRRTL